MEQFILLCPCVNIHIQYSGLWLHRHSLYRHLSLYRHFVNSRLPLLSKSLLILTHFSQDSLVISTFYKYFYCYFLTFQTFFDFCSFSKIISYHRTSILTKIDSILDTIIWKTTKNIVIIDAKNIIHFPCLINCQNLCFLCY